MITFTNANIRVIPQCGWIDDPPDIEGKDLKLTPGLLSSLGGSVQDEMDLSKYFRPVSDQMQFPSCTANAVADAWEAQIALNKVKTGTPLEDSVRLTPDLSRMFLWFNGRQEMDPPAGYDITSGCFNRLILNVVARHGVPTESRWPYTLENATKRPSIMAYRDAYVNMCDAFYTIADRGEDKFNLILQALANQHSVVFGTDLEQSFMEYKSGIIYAPQSKIIGQHALVIVGWSKSRQAFKIRNSWSEYWGEQGYCWMHVSYIINYLGSKAFWVITKGLLK